MKEILESSRKGFTLIEILIVVAIIAILASVVLVGLGPTQQQGRDARRISDLAEVQNGLQLYFNKCGYFPGAAQANACGAYSANNTWAGMSGALTGSNLSIASVPNDPTSGKAYLYGAAAGGTSYTLGAILENTTNPALNTDIDGTSNGVACADPTYCVTL